MDDNIVVTKRLNRVPRCICWGARMLSMLSVEGEGELIDHRAAVI